MRTCSNCGAPLDNDALFCTECGTKAAPIGIHCPNCGVGVENNSAFCPECGTPMGGTPVLPPVSNQYSQQQNTQTGRSTRSSSDDIALQPEKKSNTLLYIVGGVLAVVLLIIGGKFLLQSKSDEGPSETQVTEQTIQKNITLYGAVDKYPITMSLNIDGSVVKGTYYYNKQGPDKVLTLSGVLNNEEMDLYEADENGRQTGHFRGYYSNGVIQGEFITQQGKSMSFRVSE
jgi:hypothetical protein